MKAAVLHAPKDIRFEEVERPYPGKGEVLVKVKAAGVCGSDIPRVMVTGTYHFPTIPGHEFSGEVAELGKGASSVIKIGDRVATVPCIPCGKCFWCKRGEFLQCDNYNYLGSRCDGGFAEFVKVPVSNLIKVPDGVDDESAAFTEPGVVALHCLERAGRVKPGETVAVFGLGSIGNLIAQWAKTSGALMVFGVDIEGEKIDIGCKVGLKDLFNARETDVVNSILKMTKGRGVNLVVEASGSSRALIDCLKVVQKLGSVALVGRVEDGVRLSREEYGLILRKELILTGSWGFDFKDSWQKVLDAIAKKKLKVKPLITHRFSLEKVKEVFDMLYNKKEFYQKVLFIPDKRE